MQFNFDKLLIDPIEPPAHLKSVYRRDYWERVCVTLALIAQTGYSTALDLLAVLSVRFSTEPQSNSLSRLVYDALPKGGLAVKLNLPLSRLLSLTVLTLTDYGKELACALGFPPVESDYERILRLHDGINQPKHTAHVLFTAYQARLRGLQVRVMPFEPDDRQPWFRPDLIIRDQYKVYAVEVETHSRNKPEKWLNKREANVVLPDPIVRYAVVSRLKTLHVPGRATDLKTLAQNAKRGDLRYFWLERW